MITIDEALRRFLAEERERAPESAEHARFLLDNLVSFLEGYGYQYVDDDLEDDFDTGDQNDFEDEEGEFITSNTPEMIPESLAEFLYYWNIRKFLGDEADARATGLLMARFMDWLAEERLANSNEAAEAAALARTAAEELPRSKRLSALLYDVVQATPSVRASDIEDDVDDFLRIVRIEPGRLWFEQDIGPIEVPEEASSLAQVGWWVNLVAVKSDGAWTIAETGFVYPRMVDEDEEDDFDWERLSGSSRPD